MRKNTVQLRFIAMPLIAISLILFSGCETLNKWFEQKPPQEEIIDTNIFKINSEADFSRKVLDSDKPVIVKFETDWCGACKTMAPVFEKSADEFVGKMKFTQVDADKQKELAQRYEIKGVPTFIFFKDGKIVEKIEGGMDEDDFVNKIKEIIKK